MLDRFKDAKWYIGGGDQLNTIIYDASDLEGDGPDGHGMVCQDAVIEDARLIAASPDLLAAAKAMLAALESVDFSPLPGIYDTIPWAALEQAIAKAEGWLVCQDGQHRCFNTDQPCGCRCDDCRDDTEPRCDICNGLINKYGSAIGHCENESDHSGRVHQDPRLRFGPPLDTCTDCMEEEASDHTNTRIQVGAGYIIVDREECQSMRHVEEGE
jgi:hypothetical protein